MNDKLVNILCWAGLVGTMATGYAFLDRAEKMTRVNPENKTVLYFKTVQPTNEVLETNTSYKN